MKKKAVVIAMAAALAVSQYAAVFAANSPGTGVVIPNEAIMTSESAWIR